LLRLLLPSLPSLPPHHWHWHHHCHRAAAAGHSHVVITAILSLLLPLQPLFIATAVTAAATASSWLPLLLPPHHCGCHCRNCCHGHRCRNHCVVATIVRTIVINQNTRADA